MQIAAGTVAAKFFLVHVEDSRQRSMPVIEHKQGLFHPRNGAGLGGFVRCNAVRVADYVACNAGELDMGAEASCRRKFPVIEVSSVLVGSLGKITHMTSTGSSIVTASSCSAGGRPMRQEI